LLSSRLVRLAGLALLQGGGFVLPERPLVGYVALFLRSTWLGSVPSAVAAFAPTLGGSTIRDAAWS
jgi:hypothetical protein